MAEFCLTLICPLNVEEKLLDTLLDDEGTEIFTSTATHTHGVPHSRLSPEEQVLGRRRAMQVQVLLDAQALDTLRQRMQREFAGTGLRYWVSPLVQEGEFA
jgi:hypothetical protein